MEAGGRDGEARPPAGRRRKPVAPEPSRTPVADGLSERRAARNAADLAWWALKAEARQRAAQRRYEAFEVVSDLDQQMKFRISGNREIKIWRAEGNVFALACEGNIIGRYPPEAIIYALRALEP